MVQKSATNRFDLVHIGPAIDIAIQVMNATSRALHQTIELSSGLGLVTDTLNKQMHLYFGNSCLLWFERSINTALM